ncbi:MAG: ATP-grasp domain-containing protein [Brevibacillus sp.]|nr:ATP-grasp domain-containing protein [Brevibacillus sp.]
MRQPRFAIVHSAAELTEAVAKMGLPCVVKPCDDSGSYDVKLFHTVQEAAEQMVKIQKEKWNARGQAREEAVLIEEYLDGPEFSVEMFTYEGETTCIGITQKSVSGAPFFVEHQHIFPALMSRELAEQVKAEVQRALQAVGIRCGATHTEVKVSAQGCAIIEINARLAGGMIPELIRQAAGIDLLEQQIKAFTGQREKLEVVCRGFAGIRFFMSDREGTFCHAEGVEQARLLPGVCEVTMTARPGDPIQPPQNAYHRLGYVIVRGRTFSETEKRLQAAAERITLVLKEEKQPIRLLQPAPM